MKQHIYSQKWLKVWKQRKCLSQFSHDPGSKIVSENAFSEFLILKSPFVEFFSCVNVISTHSVLKELNLASFSKTYLFHCSGSKVIFGKADCERCHDRNGKCCLINQS